MREAFLESRGIAYRTNEHAPGRKTVLFVHGLSGSAAAWAPYEEALGGAYNIITFDLRGHGLSARPREYRHYALGYFADDMAHLLRHLGAERCAVVSHSFGTLAALHFVRAHPQYAERALFISPVWGVRRLLAVRLARFALAAGMPLVRALPAGPAVPRRHPYRFNMGERDWGVRRIRADLKTTGLGPYLQSLRHVYADDHDPLWARLALPVRIVHGEQDSIVPVRNARALAARVRGAALATIPGGNHVVVLNNVDDIVRHIREFI